MPMTAFLGMPPSLRSARMAWLGHKRPPGDFSNFERLVSWPLRGPHTAEETKCSAKRRKTMRRVDARLRTLAQRADFPNLLLSPGMRWEIRPAFNASHNFRTSVGVDVFPRHPSDYVLRSTKPELAAAVLYLQKMKLPARLFQVRRQLSHKKLKRLFSCSVRYFGDRHRLF
jgi:hypothetical protein